MSDVQIFSRKSLLPGSGKIEFDFEKRLVRLVNCVRPRKFMNLFPIKLVECSFEEIWKVGKSSAEGMRFAKVNLPAGDLVLCDDDWPDFDELADLFSSLENLGVCPEELKNLKTDYFMVGAVGAIILVGVLAVVGTVLRWW